MDGEAGVFREKLPGLDETKVGRMLVSLVSRLFFTGTFDNCQAVLNASISQFSLGRRLRPFLMDHTKTEPKFSGGESIGALLEEEAGSKGRQVTEGGGQVGGLWHWRRK